MVDVLEKMMGALRAVSMVKMKAELMVACWEQKMVDMTAKMKAALMVASMVALMVDVLEKMMVALMAVSMVKMKAEWMVACWERWMVDLMVDLMV